MFKTLLTLVFLGISIDTIYGQDSIKADEYFKLGFLYKGLFNTAVNTQINYYTAKLFLIGKGELPKGVRPEKKDHILYYRGLCYYYQGDVKKAMLDFKKIPKSSDKYIESIIRLGACYYKQKGIKKAIRLWNKAYLLSKNEPKFISKLGNLYAELGINIPTATTYCKKDKLGEIGLVWISLHKKDIDNALGLIEKIEAKKPDLIVNRGRWKEITYISRFYDPGILAIKAQVYLNASIKYYQNKVMTERNDYLCCKIGIAQLMSGNLNESITTLEPLTHSNNWEVRAKALINLGIAYYLRGEKQNADNSWNIVINSYRNKQLVMSELGYTYARLGIRLDKALSLCTDKPGTFSYHLGMVHFKKGILMDSLDYINSAPTLLEGNRRFKAGYDPMYDNGLFLLDLANAYFIRKDFTFSEEILSWFCKKYSDAEGIFYNIQGMAISWEYLQWEQNWMITWKDMWYF